MGVSSSAGFGDRLALALRERPLCVGIDPSADLLVAWGLSVTPAGLTAFASRVLDAVEGLVAVVKPQSAFFERFGSAGMAVLENLCRDARARGLMVLLDAKRGDIGSTSQAYAEAYLAADSPYDLDAMTATPYLGVASLAPMFAAAQASGRGVFVVARSSNPEGVHIQDAIVDGAGNGTGDVVSHVLDEVGAVNQSRPVPSSVPSGSCSAPPARPTGTTSRHSAARFSRLVSARRARASTT